MKESELMLYENIYYFSSIEVVTCVHGGDDARVLQVL